MVSAAAFINNGCMFECLVVGFQDKTMYIGEWAMACESMESINLGTTCFNSTQKLTNQKRPKMSQVQCH